MQDVVHERIDPEGGDVRVGAQIPCSVEVDVGSAVFAPAVAAKVVGRIELRLMHVGAVDEVIVRIEEVGRCDDRRVSKWILAA